MLMRGRFGAYGGVKLYDPTALENGFERGAAYGVGLRLAAAKQASFNSTNVNLEYGQSFMEYLRDHDGTDGLLPKVIASYNAGPVPITAWNTRYAQSDPLLHIESLPYWETRGYVPIILRNYWIYADRGADREVRHPCESKGARSARAGDRRCHRRELPGFSDGLPQPRSSLTQRPPSEHPQPRAPLQREQPFDAGGYRGPRGPSQGTPGVSSAARSSGRGPRGP